MTDRRGDLFCAALVALIIGMMALTFFAHPAYGQERCTSQSFDPPLESGWLMPGPADRIEVMFADGTGSTFVGPFVLGDVISHPGRIATTLIKCSGSAPEPEPTPTVEPTPEPTPPSEDSCCTTVVFPTPTPEPTPVVPCCAVVPTPTPELVTNTPTPTVPATPTPPVPELPETGATTDLLVVFGLLALAGGLMLATHRRWS